MKSSRIGESLKAARARAGWSREALAYHSGLSWSAIAQIESGRRQDVRLSSLSALAAALRVSVDYLMGTAAMSPQLLEHRVLAYQSDEAFLAAAVPFLAEGMERSHSLLAVTTPAQIGLLRETLDDRSKHVDFADSVDWYRSPREAVSRYRAYLTQKFDAGAAWVRVVGELPLAEKSEAEVTAWTRYESLVNLAFASSPVSLVCPYDVTSLPAAVVADASRTHPEVTHGSEVTASPMYRAPEDFLVEFN